MVGLGPSANAFWLENAQFNTPRPYDEVWVVNRAALAFRHDVAFDMHDLRQLVKQYPQEWPRFAQAEKPIVTLSHYPEFPTTIPYPIREVLEFCEHDVLNSTPAYMVMYAAMIGVKEIQLYGMDFHYQDLDRAEAGGQGMAYALGLCQGKGIQYRIPSSSSLLDACKVHLIEADGKQFAVRPLYGYADSDSTPDPRIPTGGKVVRLVPPPQQMSVQDARYSLGEAEQGDLVVAQGA